MFGDGHGISIFLPPQFLFSPLHEMSNETGNTNLQNCNSWQNNLGLLASQSISKANYNVTYNGLCSNDIS